MFGTEKLTKRIDKLVYDLEYKSADIRHLREHVTQLESQIARAVLNIPKAEKLIAEYKELGGDLTLEYSYINNRIISKETEPLPHGMHKTDAEIFYHHENPKLSIDMWHFECNILCELRKQELELLKNINKKR